MVMVLEQDVFKRMTKAISDSSVNTILDKECNPMGCKKLFEKKNTSLLKEDK